MHLTMHKGPCYLLCDIAYGFITKVNILYAWLPLIV